MNELIFATQNPNKVKEIQAQLNGFKVLSLIDLNYLTELEETQNTLEGNAKQKASFVFNKFNTNCFSDDTGLEIEALGGEPGVLSARYAGEEKSAEANMSLVLQKLGKLANRKAKFRTVLSLYWEGEYHEFEGICEGQITHKKRGGNGFGYDPIFKPNGSKKTLAEHTLKEKAMISHRGLAVKKLIAFLNAQMID